MNVTQGLPGAVMDESLGVPAHYANPFAEGNRLAAGEAFTDLSFLEVLSVSGVERATWLHNLTTRDFTALAPGESSEMLLLSPNGHVEAAAAVVDDGERTWFLMDTGCSEPFAQFLESMQFRMRVEVERWEGEQKPAVIGLMVPADELSEKTRTHATVIWEDPWPRTLPGGAHYGVADENHPARNANRTLLVVAQNEPVVETLIAAGFVPAGVQAWEAKRIAQWRPRPNTEAANQVLPHELDWLRTAVHLDKGCYRGQETVAKLVNLGKPPRRLTYLYLEGPEGDLPEPGAEVTSGGRTVGQLTSVARDSEDGPVALALLRRATALDAQLEVGAFVASQEEIVAREGKSSVSPQERPGQGLRRSNRGGGPGSADGGAGAFGSARGGLGSR
ncbi:CAF17-like 4Fe-4S cluster assembly/insertion protein YgfZ [Trueperella bialowiezensis]|uniref:Glycine cleavage system aminomethyltransferase T n=1 Tax=Trueperella bialowiezensis TaxID=312285 RepID=A0A3S4V7B7_9ACTO|nr:folate-binding protein YgfZ [Trueperella bialowiezensis]VEI13613.1 glycine cleavage system aminomethyltransferase T [Trueperella bialowiezensis]